MVYEIFNFVILDFKKESLYPKHDKNLSCMSYQQKHVEN